MCRQALTGQSVKKSVPCSKVIKTPADPKTGYSRKRDNSKACHPGEMLSHAGQEPQGPPPSGLLEADTPAPDCRRGGWTSPSANFHRINSAHGTLEAVCREFGAVVLGSILRAAIGMMDAAFGRPPALDCGPEGRAAGASLACRRSPTLEPLHFNLAPWTLCPFVPRKRLRGTLLIGSVELGRPEQRQGGGPLAKNPCRPYHPCPPFRRHREASRGRLLSGARRPSPRS
jgi:hypothetical protein